MSEGNATDTFSGTKEIREEMLATSDALSIKLTEEKFLATIGKRIENGEKFWDKELSLSKVRELNELRYLNQNFEASGQTDLYEHEVMFRDNRIFVSVETLASNLVSKIPVPEVTEGQDTDASRELAENYGKVLFRKAEDLHLKAVLQMVARHLLIGYRLGVVKGCWDFNSGRLKSDGSFTGDVSVNYVRPQKIVIDGDTENVERIPLIAENVKKSVEEIGFLFPDKKDEFIKAVGAATGSPHIGMNTKVGFWEAWFSYFDEEGNLQEGLGFKYKNIALDYGINPYYNYDGNVSKTNFLDIPPKPYILFNFLNTGRWAIDDTSLTEQASSQQDILERRGRQVVENADQSVSAKIFNTQMIDAKDAEKYIGDPRQNILVKGDVRMAFNRIPPAELGRVVLEDKYDARKEIDNIFGTHAPLRGEKTESPTLGQEVMSQRSDLGRVVTLSEAMEMGAVGVYRLMTQLYKVYAKEEQFVKHIGQEVGGTTFIAFSKDKIEDGVEIRVQAGSLSPDDKLTDRNEAVELAKIGGRIDPLSFAEKWHIDRPREFATRLFYFLFMPDKYASEVLHIGESGGDQEAMQTIQAITAGENVPPKQNPTKEYLAYFNQFIQSPAFKQQDPEVQRIMIEHIRGTVESAKSGLGEKSTKKPNIAQRFTGLFQGGQQ